MLLDDGWGQSLWQQMQDAEKLDAVIRGNLEVLGYAE